MSRKSNFKLYRVWDGIVQRCNNPNAKNYQNYGGRGIKMSDAGEKISQNLKSIVWQTAGNMGCKLTE